jgi:hypothetical protein
MTQMSTYRPMIFESMRIVPHHTLTRNPLSPQILQLYVAAYQEAGVWKEAWKHLCGVISVQIIRDVETFVSSNAFAAEEVMRFVIGAR